MILLDLFCGAGGSAMGLKQAGFEKIYGIDIQDFKAVYPFHFIQYDVMDLDLKTVSKCDLIWASPPCQAYSVGGNNVSREKYPKLIEPLRKKLLEFGKPFVIENVPKAPLRKDLMLCGEMFGLKVIRHRVFEIHGFNVPQPKHIRHKGTVSSGEYQGVYTGGRCGCFGNNEKRAKLKVGTIKDWQQAMGIDWMRTRKELAESVPPAYSKYIGECFLRSKKKQVDHSSMQQQKIRPSTFGIRHGICVCTLCGMKLTRNKDRRCWDCKDALSKKRRKQKGVI